MQTDATIPAVNNANCAQCGQEFTPARRTARYCTPACRQAHHRNEQVKSWRACEGIDCHNEIPPWTRRDARYCSPQCRQYHYDTYDRPIPLQALSGVTELLHDLDTRKDKQR